MKFILFFVLPFLAVCLVLHLLAKRRARRIHEELLSTNRAYARDMAAHLDSRQKSSSGRVLTHSEANVEMERRKRYFHIRGDDSNDIMNPTHPLSPLNPIGFNGPHTSVTMANDERPHHQTCHTGSDTHESNRNSSGSDWGGSYSSDSSSYSSSDSGSSSSSCD